MPELPEVETVRKSLKAFVVGRKIKNIKVIYPTIIANTSAQEINKKLVNLEFGNVDRVGKFLLFRIGGFTLISHLRMEGKYYFGKYRGVNHPNKSLVEVDLTSEMIDQFHKHIHLIFELDDNSLLIYHDTRKFGRFHLYQTGQELNKGPLLKLGSEPFTLTPAQLYQGLKKRTIPIKQALLDQNLIAGLGNIYVDETLFLSNINPFLSANKVTNSMAKSLIDSSIIVLNKAINSGGSTIRSYHVDNEVSGKFQHELNVYGKEGQPCKKCKTNVVKTFINGRGTHFCPQCQVLPLNAKPRVIGVTGIINSGKSTVANLISKYNYQVIDADKLAKQGYQDPKVIKKIIKIFGSEIKNNGQIDFSNLRTKALNTKNGIHKLESIIHPYVINQTKTLLRDHPHQSFVLDVPLLFEAKMDKLCDLIIFVTLNEKVWRSRVLKASKMPLIEAKALRKRLLSDEFKVKNSQIIIENSGDLDDLKRQINHFSYILKP
jgi:DNA-formamidopyrimidine glycosylase/dephospho-CoA kinase